MKKILAVLLAFVLMISLGACGNRTYELALVTDIGTIDDGSFNQGAWEGLEQFAIDNEITYKYYQPTTATTDDRVATIELAIENGATTVVTPGYMFENVIWQVQTDYPDVYFIFLDGAPSNIVTPDDDSTPDVDETEYLPGSTAADTTITDNTLSIYYKEDQSGFLAGYAAVKDGNTELGFIGGVALPAVVRFGYGFIQGAAYAAEEDSVEVNVNYWYSNVFWEDSNVQSKAVSWYTGGSEVIFACAGGAGGSVMTAAEQESGLVIGVDVNQAGASTTVITSAQKELANSVYDTLASIYDDTFEGGQSIILGVTSDGVGLPTDTDSWRFDTFTVTEYNAILALLVDGTIVVDDDTTVTPDSFDEAGVITVTVEE